MGLLLEVGIAELPQQPAEQEHHLGSNDLFVVDIVAEVLAQDLYDMMAGFGTHIPEHIEAVMLCSLRDGGGYEGIDDAAFSQTSQELVLEVFLAHHDGDDYIVFAEVSDAVHDPRVEDAEISLRHAHFGPVDHLRAGAGIDIEELGGFVDMVGDMGIAGLLADTEVRFLQQRVEGEEIDFASIDHDLTNLAIALGKLAGTFHTMAEFCRRCFPECLIELSLFHHLLLPRGGDL